MSISSAWASHSGMGRMASSCFSRYRNVSRAGVVLGGCAVAISRSTKGPKPVRRSSIALPTRSWFCDSHGSVVVGSGRPRTESFNSVHHGLKAR